MIIKKNFDDFKNIVQNKKKVIIIFKSNNFMERYVFRLRLATPSDSGYFFLQSYKDILIEDNKIKISLNLNESLENSYLYRVEFIRDSKTNFIKIKNNFLGRYSWYFFNNSIRNRIINNWNSI